MTANGELMTKTTDQTTTVLAVVEHLTFYRDHPDFGCETASEQLTNVLTAAGIASRPVEFEDPACGRGVECHVAVHLLATDEIVDLTYGQYDPATPWPLIEPLEVYRARFGHGPRHVELLDRWADAGWDIDGFIADRLAAGAPVPASYIPDPGPYGAGSDEWFARLCETDPILFHVTDKANADSIAAHGLNVVDAGATRASHDSVPSRGDCVYLGSEQLLRDGWLHLWSGFADTEATVIGVRTETLERARLVPDEDVVDPGMCALIDAADFGIVEPCDRRWPSAGDWARAVRLGAQPGIVEATWAARGTIAHLGPISAGQLAPRS